MSAARDVRRRIVKAHRDVASLRANGIEPTPKLVAFVQANPVPGPVRVPVKSAREQAQEAVWRQREDAALAGRQDLRRACTACYEEIVITAAAQAFFVARGRPWPTTCPKCIRSMRCRRCGRPADGLCGQCKNIVRGGGLGRSTLADGEQEGAA